VLGRKAEDFLRRLFQCAHGKLNLSLRDDQEQIEDSPQIT
jgi:hypothetical protein